MDYEVLYEIIRNLTRIFAALLLIKYTLFLVVAPFHHVKEAYRQLQVAKRGRRKVYQPLVSVLVPAWNEEVGIMSTVNSLLNNTYPLIEVVVVNDGSTDKTDSIIKKFIAKNKHTFSKSGHSVVYDYKENGGKGQALNHAISKANGEILITVDADSIADERMVENIVKYFADDDVDAAVGNVKVAGELSVINLLQRLEYLFGFYHKKAHSVLGAEYIYGGACAAFRKSTVFDAIGVFDSSSITEDIEMSLRTRANGHTAVYADDALCYTEGASSIVGLLKQRLRWKKGRTEAFMLYRKLFFSVRARHNRWLTWFILPFALLAELQLLFEPIGLTLLLIYSVITGDYSSLILGALFIGIMYLVVGLFTERGRNWWILPIYPFTWAIFYLLVWIEYVALLKTLSATVREETVAWQKWQRKGIAQNSQKRKGNFMKTKDIVIATLLFLTLGLVTAEIVKYHLTGNHLLFNSPTEQYEGSVSRCTNTDKTKRPSTTDIQLKAVSDYERVCDSAFLDGMMIFTNMPISDPSAIESANKITKRLQEFDKFGLKPIVIVEPDSDWGLVDLEEYTAGYYDDWINTYFKQLRANGITDEQMGLWIPFPEPQQEFWTNSTPENFSSSVNKYLKTLRSYFPKGKTGILLDSETGESSQASQLLAYTRLVDVSLVDVAGLQGFPWDPTEEGDTRSRVTYASDFAPAALAKEVADSLDTKEVLLNIGSYRHRKGANGNDIAITTELRKASLDSILNEASELKGYNVTISLFAENKYATSEGVDWSYWAPGDTYKSEQMALFTDFVRAAKQGQYAFYIFDSRQ